MMANHITNLIRKLVPQPPTSIEDIYPCLVGQRERNLERMNAIKAEMGTKWILHPSHKAKKLKNRRPV